jgi:hypothetical protein
MNREPVLTVSAIVALIEAGITLLTVFGVIQITDTQQKALIAFIQLLIPVLGALVARHQVTPVADPKDYEGRSLKPVP